ncbi:MAG TPA: hypothetical protein VFN05_00775, partial [Actinomycetes bacterium]|nr:hypothetical protein [Actinomycetes bacterium]
MLVDVPLLHLDRPFTYRVPSTLTGQVHLGTRVKVPFGRRRRVDGWVVGHTDELPPDARDLLRVVSPIPSFGPAELHLLRWVADRYAAAVIDTLRLAIPPRVAAVEKTLEGGAVDPAGPTPHPPGPAAPHPPDLVPGAPVREGSPLPTMGDPVVHSPPQPLAPPLRRSALESADPLTAMVRRGRTGAVYWRPLPGEDRGARVIALIEAVLE